MIYYMETNIVALNIAVILLVLGRRISSRNESSQIVMNIMVGVLVLFCISDMAAYYFRGKNYLGVELANMVYFMTMAAGAYAWYIYICIKVGYRQTLELKLRPSSIPIALLCIAITLNPWTGFFFTVDSQFLYHRGSGVFVTWIVEWGYILWAMVLNIQALRKEKGSYRRQEYKGYLLYVLPMATCAICQMMFYGITIMQVGFAIALLLAFLNKQYYQVQRDELTGLSNKNAFLNYQDTVLNKGVSDFKLMMVDADHFKYINDTYGHMMGDMAIRDIASALMQAAASYERSRVAVFRFGGDEFVIVARNTTDEEMLRLREQVQQEIQKINARNREDGEPYVLEVSIGVAGRNCTSIEDFEALVKEADAAMYEDKMAKRA